MTLEKVKKNIMRNRSVSDMPLREGDTEIQTVGCRHTNPDICAKNGLHGKCALPIKITFALLRQRHGRKNT